MLHYVAAGSGTPVVMIHGAGSLVQDFVLSILPVAAQRWRVYAFDRPGMGYSTRPGRQDWTPSRQAALLLRAIRRLGIRRPILLAHSWGTLVALAMALEAPEAVAGLVLLGGYYYPQSSLQALASRMLSPPVAPVAARTVAPLALRAAAGWLARKNFAPEPVPVSFSAGFPADLVMRPSHLDATMRDMAALPASAEHLMPHYRDVHQPVAILAGTADQIVDSREHSVRLALDLPNVRLHLLAGAGHMIHHVRREAVLAAIDDVARRARVNGAN